MRRGATPSAAAAAAAAAAVSAPARRRPARTVALDLPVSLTAFGTPARPPFPVSAARLLHTSTGSGASAAAAAAPPPAPPLLPRTHAAVAALQDASSAVDAAAAGSGPPPPASTASTAAAPPESALAEALGLAVDELAALVARPLPALAAAAPALARVLLPALPALVGCALDDRHGVAARGLAAEGARLVADALALTGGARHAPEPGALAAAVGAWGAATGFTELSAEPSERRPQPKPLHRWLRDALQALLLAQQHQQHQHATNTLTAPTSAGGEAPAASAPQPQRPSSLLQRRPASAGSTTAAPAPTALRLQYWSPPQLLALLAGLDSLVPLPGRAGPLFPGTTTIGTGGGSNGGSDGSGSGALSATLLEAQSRHARLHSDAVHLLVWAPADALATSRHRASLPPVAGTRRFVSPPVAPLAAQQPSPPTGRSMPSSSPPAAVQKQSEAVRSGSRREPRRRGRLPNFLDDDGAAAAAGNAAESAATPPADPPQPQPPASSLGGLRERLRRLLPFARPAADGGEPLAPVRPHAVVFIPTSGTPAAPAPAADADEPQPAAEDDAATPAAPPHLSRDRPEPIVRYLLRTSRRAASAEHAAVLAVPSHADAGAAVEAVVRAVSDELTRRLAAAVTQPSHGPLQAAPAASRASNLASAALLDELGVDVTTATRAHAVARPATAQLSAPDVAALAFTCASLHLPPSHPLWAAVAGWAQQQAAAAAPPPSPSQSDTSSATAAAWLTIAHVLRLTSGTTDAAAAAVAAITRRLLSSTSPGAAALGLGTRECTVLAAAVAGVASRGAVGYAGASRLFYPPPLPHAHRARVAAAAASAADEPSHLLDAAPELDSVAALARLADAAVSQLLPPTAVALVTAHPVAAPAAVAGDATPSPPQPSSLLGALATAGPAPLPFDALFLRLLPLVRAYGDRFVLYPPLYAAAQLALTGALARAAPHTALGAGGVRLPQLTLVVDALRLGGAGCYGLVVAVCDGLTAPESVHLAARAPAQRLLQLSQAVLRTGVVHGPLLGAVVERYAGELRRWRRLLDDVAAYTAQPQATAASSPAGSADGGALPAPWRAVVYPLTTARELLHQLLLSGAAPHYPSTVRELVSFIEDTLVARARQLQQQAAAGDRRRGSTPLKSSNSNNNLAANSKERGTPSQQGRAATVRDGGGVAADTAQPHLTAAAAQLVEPRAWTKLRLCQQALAAASAAAAGIRGSGGDGSCADAGTFVGVGWRMPPPTTRPPLATFSDALLCALTALPPVAAAAAAAASHQQRPLVAHHRAAMAVSAPPPPPSSLERRVHVDLAALCAGAGLPQPARGVPVGGSSGGGGGAVYHADFAWPAARVAVEADGPTHYLPLPVEGQLAALRAIAAGGGDGLVDAADAVRVATADLPGEARPVSDGSSASTAVVVNPLLRQPWPCVPLPLGGRSACDGSLSPLPPVPAPGVAPAGKGASAAAAHARQPQAAFHHHHWCVSRALRLDDQLRDAVISAATAAGAKKAAGNGDAPPPSSPAEAQDASWVVVHLPQAEMDAATHAARAAALAAAVSSGGGGATPSGATLAHAASAARRAWIERRLREAGAWERLVALKRRA
jgi:hypothetical protein